MNYVNHLMDFYSHGRDASYEIQEIIDRMSDTGIRSTIAEIRGYSYLDEDDPNYDKKKRRQKYLYINGRTIQLR